MPFIGPSQIDIPFSQNWPFQRRQAWTAYEFGGALFTVVTTGGGTCSIYKSTDGLMGAAWADLGLSVARDTCTAVRKADVLYFLYAVPGEIRLVPFDLPTETLGAVVGGGPVSATNNNFTIIGHLRSDGDIDFCFRDATLLNPKLYAATYSFTTGWSAAVQVDVAVAGTDPQILTSIESGNDRLHVLWYAVNGGDPAVYHRSYLNGVLSANSVFLATTGVAIPFCNIGVGVWNPNTSELLLPVVIGAAGAGVLYVYRAGDAATPAWAQGVALSAGYVPGTCLFTHYFVMMRGTDEEIYWNNYQVLTPLGSNFLIRQVNSGAGYGVEQAIYDSSTWGQPSSWHNIFAIPLSDGTVGITGSMESNLFCVAVFAKWVGLPPPTTLAIDKVQVPGADPGLWNLQIDGVTVGTGANVGDGGTTGAIAVGDGPHQAGETPMPGTNPADYITTFGGDLAQDGSIIMHLGDVKVGIITNTRRPAAPQVNQGGFRRMVVLIPNRFDQILRDELRQHQINRPEKACCQPILWRDISWVRAPQNYIPFRKVGTVPTPLAASGDVEVLNFQVPPGYDGLIAGLFNVYTGPGFRDGNGDIEWRLIINRTYAIHLGQIMVTLGSQDNPYPVDGGIFIQSGTRIRYIVNVPNLSGGILPLASQIVCGLEGLFYART